jgi:hypothetical protein
MGAIMGWLVVLALVAVPLNWMRLWAVGAIPAGTEPWMLVAAGVMFAIAGVLGWALIRWRRSERLREMVSLKAREIAEDAVETMLEKMRAAPLEPIKPSRALLKSGEIAYAAVRGTLQEEKILRYEAGSAGVSVRVMKGVSVRTGGTRGGAVRGVVDVAEGELVITNRRVIFAGDRKSFSVEHDGVLNTTNYRDGFGVSTATRTYAIETGTSIERAWFAVAMDRILRERELERVRSTEGERT